MSALDARSVDGRPSDNELVIAGQRTALELALHGAPLPAVLEVLARTVEAQSSNGVLASILLYDAQKRQLRHGAAPSLPAAYNEAIDGIAVGPTVGSCGTAAFTGEIVVVSDISGDARWREFKALAESHSLRACWSMPILTASQEVLGTFALYHRVPTVPSERDVSIVELLARTAALVIEREREARAKALAVAALQGNQQEQLARIATMFEHAPAGIAVLRGPDLIFEVANPTYAAYVHGRPLLGKPLREAIPEAEEQGFCALLDEVYRTGRPYNGQGQRAVLKRPDGRTEEIYADFVYQPVPGPDGNIDTILIVAFEVTELVRARLAAEAERLRAEESERLLRTFVDSLPALAWTARPDGYIDYYNQRWYEYTGTTFEEMQGWGWSKVHDPELLPQVTARWQHSLATGEPFQMEFTLRGHDGIARWFLTRVAPSRDASGKVVRWFGTNTDIDDIKTAQALSTAMAEQSLDVQRELLALRAAKDRAEQRVAELEASRAKGE